ncbi:hypothetical protein BLOT_009768 [Blomia tropicalis]|nr:hypothetical protein BLOT_009768 [Blomia tropicalis]
MSALAVVRSTSAIDPVFFSYIREQQQQQQQKRRITAALLGNRYKMLVRLEQSMNTLRMDECDNLI